MTFRKIYHGLTLLVLAVCAVMLQACSDDPDPVPPQQTCPTTVLVYMAARNSLGSNGYDAKDMQEMSAAVSRGDLQGGRLLVYRASADGTTMLSELTPDGMKVVADYGKSALLSVHGERMADVIAKAKAYAPSQRFGLVLWSHASGWLQNGIDDPAYPAEQPGKRRSWGDEGGRYMNVTTLARVLETAKPDWMWFDCCLMANVETLYELRRATPTIVASSIELPPNGMPYDLTLRHLFRPSGSDLESAARATYGYYRDGAGDDGRRDCALTVVNTDALEALATVTGDVYAAAPKLVPDGYNPRYLTLSNRYYADMEHYVKALCATAPGGEALQQAWQTAFDNVVKYSESTPNLKKKLGIADDTSCAISTYIYQNAQEAGRKNYGELEWPYRTGVLNAD